MAEKKAPQRYVVTPRTNEGYKELYCKAGKDTIVFGQPYVLDDRQLASLRNQKESVKSTGVQTPYDVARERGISIDKAIEMLDKMGNTVDVGSLTWLPRYEIHEV